MVSLGFTGTRRGMLENQRELLIYILREEKFTEYHHGDCVGADKQFHEIVKDMEGVVHVHPPTDRTYRAFCKGGIIYPPKPFLERNRDIVDASDILIAMPSRDDQINKIRSGTWYTVRYAKTQFLDIVIII